MSITAPAPTAAPANNTPPRPVAPQGVARLVAPAALSVGSVLAAIGMALHLGAMPEDVRLAIAIAEDPQWLTSHLFLGFGFAIVAIGAASALSLVRGRGATVTAVALVFTALGALVFSLSDMAHGAVGFALGDHVDPATSLDIHMAYFEHPAILGLNTGPLLLTVGMILLGVGLLRSRAVPRWMGIVVLLAPIGVNAAITLGLPTYLHGVPMAVGMTVFAGAIARR